MAMRHLFSKLQKTRPQNCTYFVNRSTVAAAIQLRTFFIEFYMHCVTCDFGDLPEINL
jgi:hypothetical protein